MPVKPSLPSHPCQPSQPGHACQPIHANQAMCPSVPASEAIHASQAMCPCVHARQVIKSSSHVAIKSCIHANQIHANQIQFHANQIHANQIHSSKSIVEGGGGGQKTKHKTYKEHGENLITLQSILAAEEPVTQFMKCWHAARVRRETSLTLG